MNITIKIDAPELVGAIESLAQALSGSGLSLPTTVPENNTADSTEADKKAAAEKAAQEKKVQETAAALKAKEAEAKKAAAAEKAEKAKKAAELAAKKAAEAEAAELAKDLGEDSAEAEISLEVVRGKLAAHAALGKDQQLEVRDALSRFGCKKLTDVNAEDYGELLELVGVAL